jgi:hypothetical protein
MSITPRSPALIKQGWVQTWVTSQWKNRPIPGQFSAEINNLGLWGELQRDFVRQIANAESIDLNHGTMTKNA